MKLKKTVLIDDMILVRREWKISAEKFGIHFYSYRTIDEFLDESSTYDKDTLIFLDRNLNNNQLGEYEAVRILERGFKYIFLCTNMQTFNTFGINTNIKIINHKNPPWEDEKFFSSLII